MLEVPKNKVYVDLQQHPITDFINDPKNQDIKAKFEQELGVELKTSWSGGSMHLFADTKEQGEIAKQALDTMYQSITIPDEKLGQILTTAKRANAAAAFNEKNQRVKSGVDTPDLATLFNRFTGKTFETGPSARGDKIYTDLLDTACDNGLQVRVLYPDQVVTTDYRTDRVNVEVQQVSVRGAGEKAWRIKGVKQG